MKIIIRIIICFVAIFIGFSILVSTNAPTVADFTDNILRPRIGDANVIKLERIYFNTIDTLARLSHKRSQNPLSSQPGESNQTISGGNLNLTPIPVPENIKPISGEGTWQQIPVQTFPNQEVIATTFIHPDASRPYAVASLVQIDTKNIALASVAGLKEPGSSTGKRGPGAIPQEILQNGSLIAAFEGGFLYNDGNYGMIVGDTVYAPLKNDTATLIGYKDGSIKIINYEGQDLGNDILFVRQNCPILIEHNTLSVLDPKNKAAWGRTLTADIYTRRSGIGITKEGNLLYASGDSLTPTTLAYALQAAGAVDAMQLDINPAWVSFDFFTQTAPGIYSDTPLVAEYRNRSKQFLKGYAKDFFYLYRK